jgi:hypothetical protein
MNGSKNSDKAQQQMKPHPLLFFICALFRQGAKYGSE